MAAGIHAIMKLEVPVIGQIGRREMALDEVLRLAPGAIIELPTSADEDLEILVNNKPIGTCRAVKVGDNFGVRVSFVGDLRERLAAMGGMGTRAQRACPAPEAHGSASLTHGTRKADPCHPGRSTGQLR